LLVSAAAKGRFLTFCLLSSQDFASGWSANPYNAKNGGPCAAPQDFWTSLQARLAFKRFLRSFIARFNSYSSFAGIQFVDSGIAPSYWLEEMHEEARALHPYPIPVFGRIQGTEEAKAMWLHAIEGASALTPTTLWAFSKPVVATEKMNAYMALASGYAAALDSAGKGFERFLQEAKLENRKFELRPVKPAGSALLDGAGGVVYVASSGQNTKCSFAAARPGKYSVRWFDVTSGLEVHTADAQTSGNDVVLDVPSAVDVAGILVRR
jgi:hypothetical protein